MNGAICILIRTGSIELASQRLKELINSVERSMFLHTRFTNDHKIPRKYRKQFLRLSKSKYQLVRKLALPFLFALAIVFCILSLKICMHARCEVNSTLTMALIRCPFPLQNAIIHARAMQCCAVLMHSLIQLLSRSLARSVACCVSLHPNPSPDLIFTKSPHQPI